MVHRAAAEGFGRGADDYAAARPGYPDGVYELLVSSMGLGPGCRVLDLAAGTGKFTAGLVARGAEVLCEYMPFGYWAGAALINATEPSDLARTIQREVDRMRPFLVDDRMLLMVGYDHAGPDATLPQRLEEAAPLMPGIDASIGSLEDHLRGRVLPDDLPVWQGELRSGARAHLLPNVVSSRVHQKLERGRVERLLERAEAAPAPAAEEELHRAWRLLVLNGAHDSACGCSHDQVATDVDARFAQARAIAEGLLGNPGTGRIEAGVADIDVSEVAGGIAIDGVELRFFDEPDVGDLYTFCWAGEGNRPSPPSRVATTGARFLAEWEGLSIEGRAAPMKSRMPSFTCRTISSAEVKRPTPTTGRGVSSRMPRTSSSCPASGTKREVPEQFSQVPCARSQRSGRSLLRAMKSRTSALERPSAPASCSDSRRVIAISPFISSRASAMTSRTKRERFPRLPPYSSLR